MQILYGKTLSEEESFSVGKIAEECGILFDTAKLLFCRGIDTPEKAKVFLSPSEKGFIDPFLFPEMKRVVDRLYIARDNGEKVLIAGDYDADGICAATILYKCLKEFGIEAGIVIPEREDGYGICLEKVGKEIEENGYSILITVDCGISEKDKIAVLLENGLDVIVTDHHEPPEDLPDCPIINPKIKSGYGFSGLCGAGVAYKLGYALISKAANKYLDFVALATVADSMDLIEENRCLVSEGLKLFSSGKIRKCFNYLLGNNNRQITAQYLAFTLAPRVNAGGRMGDAASALKLFLSEDDNEIFDLSVKLNGYNIARQAECDEIFRASETKIKDSGAYKRSVIMVYDREWTAGVVGIVAAKLVEKYNRPVIVFTGREEDLKGSARSVDGVNIFEAISSAKELLTGFGGHSQAAGVSLKEENFGAFYDRIDEYLKDKIIPEECEETVFVEWETDDISVRFAREIDMLEPFGTGNKRPLFSVRVKSVKPTPLKVGSDHYSFFAGKTEILDFNGEKDVFSLRLPVEKRIVYEVNYSIYKGRESVKGYLKKISADFNGEDLSLYYFESALINARNGGPSSVCEIKKQELSDGYGTLYIAKDEDALKEFDLKTLPVRYFEPLKSGRNSVCVGATDIPSCYEKVVYLDRQLRYIDTAAESFVFSGDYGKEFLSLRTDRDVFAEKFERIKALVGKEFTGSVDFAHENASESDARQFIFCLETFFELGILSARNGRLYYDNKVKNALTNSKIYCAVADLKRNER